MTKGGEERTGRNGEEFPGDPIQRFVHFCIDQCRVSRDVFMYAILMTQVSRDRSKTKLIGLVVVICVIDRCQAEPIALPLSVTASRRGVGALGEISLLKSISST